MGRTRSCCKNETPPGGGAGAGGEPKRAWGGAPVKKTAEFPEK